MILDLATGAVDREHDRLASTGPSDDDAGLGDLGQDTSNG